MHIKTRGIVLQIVNYSESSVIARIFTEKLGLITYMVNGVRSPKAIAKAAMMRPLQLLDLEVTQRENKNMQRIREFRRAYNYQTIPFDVAKSGIALFLLEVVSKTVKENDVNESLFEFVYDQLLLLDEPPPATPHFHLQFLLHYAHYLGFGPHDNYSSQTPCFDLQEGVFVEGRYTSAVVLPELLSQAVHLLCKTSPVARIELPLPKTQRRELLNGLLRYYQLHVEGFGHLKSHEVLEAVFGS